ncbi:MAG TPA: hypothetical protein VFZ58_04035 [Candidatus Saccharimonadales bacterium]
MQPNTPSSQEPQQTAAAPAMQPAQLQPAPKNRKPLIIWLVTGSIALLAVIVAVVVYFTMFNIAKDDYKRALEAAQSVNEKVESLKTTITELNADNNAKLAEATPKIQTAVKDARTAIDALGKEKALNDKEVKEKSDTYLAKLDKTVTYLDDYSTDTVSLRIMINECSSALEAQSEGNSPSTVAQSLNKMGDDLSDCTKKLSDAEEKMKSDDVRALARTFIGPYEVIAEQSKQAAQAFSTGNLAAYDQASAKMGQAIKDMATDSVDVLKQIAEHIKTADPTEEYGALTAVLERKAK